MKMTLDIGGTKTLWTIWHDTLILDRGTAATNTITDFTEFIRLQIDSFVTDHADIVSSACGEFFGYFIVGINAFFLFIGKYNHFGSPSIKI